MKNDAISAPFSVLEAFIIEAFIANRFPEVITVPGKLPPDTLERLTFLYQSAVETLNDAESNLEAPEKLNSWVSDANDLIDTAISQG